MNGKARQMTVPLLRFDQTYETSTKAHFRHYVTAQSTTDERHSQNAPNAKLNGLILEKNPMRIQSETANKKSIVYDIHQANRSLSDTRKSSTT